jgi:hypothetical protein
VAVKFSNVLIGLSRSTATKGRNHLKAWGVIPQVFLFLVLSTGWSITAALAQPKPNAQAAPAAVPASAPNTPTPEADRVVLLVRTTLLTLNDALLTGNFTVFRDRASLSFQASNSAARLSVFFSDLMSRQVDLTGSAIVVPQLRATPTIDANGRLRIVGQFQGQPAAIAFDLIFEPVAGQWRLFGISVNTVTASAGARQPTAEEQSKTPAAPDKKAAKK